MKHFRRIFLSAVLLLCLSALSLGVSAFDVTDVRAPESASKLVYGHSGAGRELVAYKFGNGNNVMITGFALHGYEDNFKKDGGCLVYTADQLMKLLDKNRSLITDYGWTIYVLPCMNPDGLMDGYTNNGPGRCTTTYLDAKGNLVKNKGVDLNRSFPFAWTQYTTARNFNGDHPLAAREAQALAQFVKDVRGKGTNVCIDAHGWYGQTITSNGEYSVLFRTFASRFPRNTYANCTNSRGYLTSYTASLGYASCLFEFPGGLYSMESFLRSGYCDAFNGCILDLLKGYGNYNGHSTVCPSAKYEDVIPWAWYHDAVDYVVRNGIFNGMSDTSFAPGKNMSRAMLVTTLWRMSKDQISAAEPVARKSLTDEEQHQDAKEQETDPPADTPDDPPDEPPDDPPEEPPDNPPEEPPEEPPDEPVTFSDVAEGAWYEEAVLWAAENGIVTGYPDGTFAPDKALTREQLATIFYRYSQWLELDVTPRAELDAFPDAGQVSDYARDAVCWAVKTGLINGVGGYGAYTLLSPGGTATRAQTATIIMRFLQGSGGDIARKSPIRNNAEPNLDEGWGDLGGN